MIILSFGIKRFQAIIVLMDDFFLLDQEYSSEEKLFRDNLREWLEQHVQPKITEYYEQGVFPTELVKQFADLGLYGITLPKEYGGSAASHITYGLVCQELERCDSGLRSFVSVQNSLCMYPIFQFGSDAQKQKYLPRMAQGDVVGCFGLTEANSGSDPASMQTHAKPHKDGWVLNGSKLWITNATIADIAIVWANTDDGIRGFIVEKGTPGFSVAELHHKLSMRASVTGELHFDDCVIPKENELPGSQKGLSAALSCLTKARFGIAWGAVGAAMACYDITLDYVKQRKQFDRPLAANQLIQSDLVSAFTEIQKAQLLNFRCAQLADKDELACVMVSMAKMNAAKQALQIARSCRNLLGANGISAEYQVMRHMNNLETVFTYEGTDNIHQLIIGRYLTDISAF